MKKPILSLPCSQRTQDLENGRDGYHCQLCAKTITDFRGKSNEEIVQTVQESPGRVCGIFEPSQYEYKVSHILLPRLKQSVGLSLLGILGFIGPVVTGCEQEPEEHLAVKLDAFRKLKFPMNLNGILNDQQTGAPIPHAQVALQQHGKTILKTTTDEKGNFAFFIRREDLHKESFDLAFGSKGYEHGLLEDLFLSDKNNGRRVKLTLQASAEKCVTSIAYPDQISGDIMIQGIEEPIHYPIALPELGEPAILREDPPTNKDHSYAPVKPADEKKSKKLFDRRKTSR